MPDAILKAPMHRGKPDACLAYMGNDDHYEACCTGQLKEGCYTFSSGELKRRASAAMALANAGFMPSPSLRLGCNVWLRFFSDSRKACPASLPGLPMR